MNKNHTANNQNKTLIEGLLFECAKKQTSAPLKRPTQKVSIPDLLGIDWV